MKRGRRALVPPALAAALLVACGGDAGSVAGAAAGNASPAEAEAAAPAGGDEALARALEAATGLVASPECLREDQAAWEAATARDCGGDAACRAAAREARLLELSGLLPGIALPAGAEPGPGGPRLLAVAGGDADPDGGDDPLHPVELRGRPLETEGGYVLAGPDFDAGAWEAFEALLGDEEAFQARFGDGPAVIPGLQGSFPAMTLDDRSLAAIDAVAAAGGQLRVRGAAVPDPDGPPALDLRACMFVYDAGA